MKHLLKQYLQAENKCNIKRYDKSKHLVLFIAILHFYLALCMQYAKCCFSVLLCKFAKI